MSAQEIHVIDTIGAIRKRPKLYFYGGQPTSETLGEHVAGDAMRASSVVGILRVDDFTLVHADADWMSVTRLNAERPEMKGVTGVADLFKRVLPRGATPAHGCRAEVLIAAASAGWITFGDGEVHSHNLAEADLPEPLRAHFRAHARALAWRFNTDSWGQLQAEPPPRDVKH